MVAVVALLPVLAASAAPAPARAAVPKVIGTNVLLDGRGFGHGRGMSQFGSFGYAVDRGWNWQQILAHYYGGTTLDPGFGNPEIGVRLLAMDGRPFTAAVRPAGGIQVNATGPTFVSVIAFQVGHNFRWMARRPLTARPTTPRSQRSTAMDALGSAPTAVRCPASTRSQDADQLIGLCQPTTHTVSDQPRGGAAPSIVCLQLRHRGHAHRRHLHTRFVPARGGAVRVAGELGHRRRRQGYECAQRPSSGGALVRHGRPSLPVCRRV
jgi:hypothetical protein